MLSQEDISQLRRLMELREKRDELKKAHSKSVEEYNEAEEELFDRLNDGPVPRLNNVDLGPPFGKVSFGKRETYYGRVIKGSEQKARDWFAANGMADVIAKPKFEEKRLNEIVRDRIEQGVVDMPDGVDYYARRGVTVTRQKD